MNYLVASFYVLAIAKGALSRREEALLDEVLCYCLLTHGVSVLALLVRAVINFSFALL